MGGKTSTTTQQVTIPKEVMDRYNAVNKRAEALADTPFQQYSTDPSAFVAQINAQQQGGFDTINNASGSYQPYLAKATDMVAVGSGSAQPRALNLDQFYNPFQSQVIDATMKQMGQANEQAQSGALGTAISSGAFGGDRAGIAAANLANQQNLAMGSTLAGLNSQNYQQALQAAMQQQGLYLGADQADLARKMQAGQMYAGLGSQALQSGLAAGEAQINAGTLEQQTEQAGKSALYNQFQQQQAYPFQIAQFLANIAMGTGALSGSTTTTTQPSSFWSDRRLKTDIKRVGTADNGLPVYTFKYKGDDAEQTHVGYMADEVEKLHPEAVGVAGNGYKFVDYDRASRASGGGVAGPYGIQAGSQDPYAAGYVPQAYLPVGELMMADPALLDRAEQSMAQQIDAMNRFGENMMALKDKYTAARDWWRGEETAAEQGEADPAKAWRGGVAGYAEGGAAYLSARGGLNPVDTKTYLSDTLENQRKRDDEVMRPASAPSQGKSGFENVLDAGKMAMTLFGFERGGVAGRHGYATDGAVDDEERKRLLREDVPAPQTLGSLPEATVQPATTPKDMGSDLGTAIRALGRDAEGYGQGQVDPSLFRAAGLAASATPAVKPAAAAPVPRDIVKLAGAAIDRASPSAPAITPTAALPQAEFDPRDFYRTNILKQESGHRQFDQNGKPLTSSAGAVGIGQILPSTGPEAAKLAGLPWDENRFYNDANYNAALGEAYFLHQFNTFGSIDKAAAAYNAGPGALSSAIDRATAMGGSYLDYLPAETQKYVLATTGLGGSGGLGGGRDRLSFAASAQPEYGSASGKPYAERNRLGQMIYDRDGRVNKDALLSILSGIGTMASSPSRYLGASILQGIGGAANTYAGLQKQAADIRNMDAETASVATQLLKNSIFQDPMTQQSYIYLQNGDTQLFTDWLTNPAGPSAAGVEGDRILRGLAENGFGGADAPFKIDYTPVETGDTISQPAPAAPAGMPVAPIQTTAITTSPFPITDADRAVIDRNTANLRNMTPEQRAAALAASEAQRAVAVGESDAASGAFRNLNELGYVMAEAANGNMGPLGGYKASMEGVIKQIATNFGLVYDGSAATDQALLNKLASLQADQMTADTAAAQLFLQNKNIFPTIESDPQAAADISAAMFVDNMMKYEYGQFANDFFSQHGPFKSMDGARQLFVEKTGNLYQAEKSNISTLLRAAASNDTPPQVRAAIKQFMTDANSGAFRSVEEAQEVLNKIFDAMPGEHGVSSGLGRYFVR